MHDNQTWNQFTSTLGQLQRHDSNMEKNRDWGNLYTFDVKIVCCSVDAKIRRNKENSSSWTRVWDYKALVEHEQFLRLKLWGFKIIK